MQSFCQDPGVLQRFSRYLRMQGDKGIEGLDTQIVLSVVHFNVDFLSSFTGVAIIINK